MQDSSNLSITEPSMCLERSISLNVTLNHTYCSGLAGDSNNGASVRTPVSSVESDSTCGDHVSQPVFLNADNSTNKKVSPTHLSTNSLPQELRFRLQEPPPDVQGHDSEHSSCFLLVTPKTAVAVSNSKNILPGIFQSKNEDVSCNLLLKKCEGEMPVSPNNDVMSATTVYNDQVRSENPAVLIKGMSYAVVQFPNNDALLSRGNVPVAVVNSSCIQGVPVAVPTRAQTMHSNDNENKSNSSCNVALPLEISSNSKFLFTLLNTSSSEVEATRAFGSSTQTQEKQRDLSSSSSTSSPGYHQSFSNCEKPNPFLNKPENTSSLIPENGPPHPHQITGILTYTYTCIDFIRNLD